MTPSGFITFQNKTGAVFKEIHTVKPVHPCILFFFINNDLCASIGFNTVYYEVVLISVHPLDPKGFAVSHPIRCAEILIVFWIEICPHSPFHPCVDNAYFHFRIYIAGFRVAGIFEETMLSLRVINGINGDKCIIKTHEGNFFAIRAPPKCFVTGWPAQDLFIVNP